MAKPINYKQVFTKQRDLEVIIRKACPTINHQSGIYFLLREDPEEHKKYGYIGKAVDLCRRMVSHMQGWKQDIDFSLRKRGFYSPENEGGYKLHFLNCPEEKLNEKEQFYIDLYRKNNYVLYNIESGGTIGKTMINERKEARGYHDGLTQGEKKTKEQVKTYFDKYLDFVIKPPTGKVKERKFQEFADFLNGTDKKENKEND